MTPAALDGIARFGNGWRYFIHLSVLVSVLGDPDLKVGMAEKVAHSAAERLREWMDKTPKLGAEERDAFTTHVEELMDVEDDLDEVRALLGRLYNDFDYYRVCAR